jgi:hypothetical protein
MKTDPVLGMAVAGGGWLVLVFGLPQRVPLMVAGGFG